MRAVVITAGCFAFAGLPGEFVAALQPDEEKSGHLVVTLKYPDYFPIMQQCRVS